MVAHTKRRTHFIFFANFLHVLFNSIPAFPCARKG
jgi:hypothetical protein